jgi:hypothetical protein
MENIASFKLRYARDPSQVKLVENQPFPHTLPGNSTPYYNDDNNHTGAGYDGPGECLKHVFGHGKRLYATTQKVVQYWMRINVSEFVVSERFPWVPLQYRLFTPELPWQSRGK